MYTPRDPYPIKKGVASYPASQPASLQPASQPAKMLKNAVDHFTDP